MNPNVRHSISIVELLTSLLRNRELVVQMTRREVIGRYRGSMIGIAWSFFNPLIMLAIYTIVFSVIFNAKWGVNLTSKTDFAMLLFIGMIVHGVLAETLSNSPALMLRNVSYVKKVVFPLEILPWIVIGSTLFHAIISLLVWSLFYIVANHTFQWTAVFIPLVFLPLVLFSLGISWLLASIGVYIRDITQVTGMLVTIFLFLSPIFYPATALPEPFRSLIYLNPLTFVIEQARDVLMWGKYPDWNGLMIATAIGLLTAWLGFAWFQKTRKGFSDVL